MVRPTSRKPVKRCGNPRCRKWHDQSRSRSYCPDCERARVRKALRKHRKKKKEQAAAEELRRQKEVERQHQLDLLHKLGTAKTAGKLIETIYEEYGPDDFARELKEIMTTAPPSLRLRATQIVLTIIQATPQNHLPE